MKKLIERAKVIFTAAPTYLVVAGLIVSSVTEEVAKELPNGWQDNALAIGGKAVAIIGTAAAIVRRVTTVLKSQRGLLGPKVKTVTIPE